MKTIYDIYLIIRRDCYYRLCTMRNKTCCDMHIIAEIMISEGEF